MDFVCLIIFLSLYYLRPQEWFAEFNALRPVQVLSVLALWGIIASGKLKLRALARTPLDWLIICYFIWTLIAGEQFMHTLTQIEAVLLFYFVAVLSLDTIKRQKIFLGWWCVFMLAIAALAIASLYGFDPLNTNDLTQGVMKGRLILNLSVFNNPNALGHSVIPVVPLIYYLFFWRRVFMRAGLLVMAIPLYCVFMTQSKGAFLCGFLTVLATLTFGRSKPMQIVILSVSLVFGLTALYALPRMNQLQNTKNDPAIQGRIAAFKYGLDLMQTHFLGIGLGNFQPVFTATGPLEKIRIVRLIPAHDILGNEGMVRHVGAVRDVHYVYQHYTKATHSAYNQNGAELGYVGLFLFVGIIYACLRTLILSKTTTDDEERIRRALFASVIAYAASSWMVDFCYRPTFFMMVAAVSAFHRHLLKKQAEGPEPAPIPAKVDRPWLRPLPPISIPGFIPPVAAGSAGYLTTAVAATAQAAAIQPVAAMQPTPPPASRGAGNSRSLDWHRSDPSIQDLLLKRFVWTRLGFPDLLIILALTYAAIWYWKHLIATM
jgi:hypothetical protein